MQRMRQLVSASLALWVLCLAGGGTAQASPSTAAGVAWVKTEALSVAFAHFGGGKPSGQRLSTQGRPGPIVKSNAGGGRARTGSTTSRSSRRLSLRQTRSPEPARQRGASLSRHVSRRVSQAAAPRDVQKENRANSPAGARRLSAYSSGSSRSARRASMQSLSSRASQGSQASQSSRPRSPSLRTAVRRASLDSTRSVRSTGSQTKPRPSERTESAERRHSPKRSTSVSEKPGYPPRSGFAGEPKSADLKPGTRFDRYGSERGRFVSPVNTPFSARGLPDTAKAKPYHKYEVVKPITVRTGTVAPWGNSPGKGTQHLLDRSIADLVKSGHLREVK